MNETDLQKQAIIEQLDRLNAQGVSKAAQLLDQVVNDHRYKKP